MSDRYDFAVVGAGILGLASARELRRRHPEARLVVLDRASRVAADQSGHNSGVIHAGLYYAAGSLKARLCVAGAARLFEYCDRQGIETRRVGKLVIAARPGELAGLEEIESRAHRNGVAGVRRLTGQEIAQIEPQATGLAALHSPNTGIVDFRAVCASLANEHRASGGELRLGWSVNEVIERSDAVLLREPRGDAVEATAAVFCAGLEADRLAMQGGADPDPRIVPFRGAYLRLRPERRALVQGLVYPVPDPALPFLGVHLTPTLGGDVLLGPTALLAGARDAYRLGRVRPRDLLDTLAWPGSRRMMRRFWRSGLAELRLALSRRAFAAQAARYVPAISPEDLEPAWAGVRAQAVGRDGRLVDDFLVSATARTVHVRNAPSPAATSALALAELIVDRLEAGQR